MIAQQIRKFDMLRHVQQFLDAFAAELTVVNATAARTELDQLVKEMGASATMQAVSTLNAKGETAAQQALRWNLVKHHMRPVATIAAAHLRDVPSFAALRMPPKNARVDVVIEAATAMADAARANQQVFVENGRSEKFADELEAAAIAVRASIDTRAKSIRTRAGAGAGLKATASRAHLILRLLDAQVQSVLVDDPKTLAMWKSAKRIGRGKAVPIEASVPAPTTGEKNAS